MGVYLRSSFAACSPSAGRVCVLNSWTYKDAHSAPLSRGAAQSLMEVDVCLMADVLAPLSYFWMCDEAAQRAAASLTGFFEIFSSRTSKKSRISRYRSCRNDGEFHLFSFITLHLLKRTKIKLLHLFTKCPAAFGGKLGRSLTRCVQTELQTEKRTRGSRPQFGLFRCLNV